MMRRREFITLLGSAAVAWPLSARAQQTAQRAKIGILYPGLASALPARIAALRDALQAVGYREPDNVEFRRSLDRRRSHSHYPGCNGVGRAQGRCYPRGQFARR